MCGENCTFLLRGKIGWNKAGSKWKHSLKITHDEFDNLIYCPERTFGISRNELKMSVLGPQSNHIIWGLDYSLIDDTRCVSFVRCLIWYRWYDGRLRATAGVIQLEIPANMSHYPPLDSYIHRYVLSTAPTLYQPHQCRLPDMCPMLIIDAITVKQQSC